jgi:hypothetical protein
MKTLFLVLVISFYSISSFAQLKQHSLLIGGGFSASSGSNKISGESINLEIEPERNSSSTTYEIGPFIRYYITVSSFAIFGEINYLYGKTLGTYEQVEYSDPLQYELVEREDNSTNSIFAPALGIVFFVNEAIGIEGALRYETGSSKTIFEGIRNETDYEFEQDFNGFSFIIGLQIHLILN